MPAHPLVSFVLLSYKQEKYIKEAVEGAFSQTYSPLEIIISDDCSPDRTFEIIEEMAAVYQGPHRIILNRNEKNLGIGAHVQKCFQLSSGEWIVGAAGDDVSEPDRVAVLIAAIQGEPCAVAAVSAYQIIDEQGNPLPTALPACLRKASVRRYGEYDWVAEYQRGVDLVIPGCAAMWHRSLFADFAELGAAIFAEDVVLGFRAHLTGSIVFLDKPLIRYRSHDANVSGIATGSSDTQADHAARSLKKSHASREMNLIDYNHYLARHPEMPSDSRIFKLIHDTLRMNEIDSTWWEHGVFWKFQTILCVVRMRGLKQLKVYLPRIFSRSIYFSYMKFTKLVKIRFGLKAH